MSNSLIDFFIFKIFNLSDYNFISLNSNYNNLYKLNINYNSNFNKFNINFYKLNINYNFNKFIFLFY